MNGPVTRVLAVVSCQRAFQLGGDRRWLSPDRRV
jgi:hypothetical protein